MKNCEIFEEFLKLEYKPSQPPTTLRDTVLNDFELLRRTSEGYTVYYLNTGSSLFIPWKWIDLFLGFYYYAGERVSESDDKLDQFIFLMTVLQCFHIGSYSRLDGDRYLDILGDICKLGTKKFISSFSINLPPIEYRSLKLNLDI